MGGGVPGVGGQQDLEHGRRLVGVGALGLEQARAPQGLRRGAGQLGVEHGPEGPEDLPQLVVGDPTVERDQTAHEVERLQGDVVAEIVDGHARDAPADRLERAADVVDEAPGGLDEGLGHRGSRHMGQMVGPEGNVTSPTTSKPCRA